MRKAREVALQTLKTDDEDAYFVFLFDYCNMLLGFGAEKEFELDVLK